LIQVLVVHGGEEASVKRTVARLLDFAVAVALLLVLASLQQLRAAEWPNVRQSDTLWPLDKLGGPQWPNVPADKLSKPQTVPASPSPVSSNAPNDAPTYAVGSIGDVAAAAVPPSRKSDDDLVTGASLDVPPLAPVKAAPQPAFFERGLPSPFVFEAGTRYWYSIGQNRFAFTNLTFPFGNPTSTLDWDRMQGHSGELFGRVDHRPTGLFAKGLIGGGLIQGGDMDDLDFFVTQINFSNTTSSVGNANLRYGMIDIGYAYEVPDAGVKFGAFVGYHYWHESMTAFGIICNADQLGNPLCGPAGAAIVDSGTAVVKYDTTWHAIRLGGEARFQVTDRWSISGEIAFVPYAWMNNDDSHLLRQDPADLGPAPNVLTRGWRGMGAEAEAFVNYQVLPNFELGAGVRYWGLFTQAGTVEFGPTFGPDFPLTKFSTQRYGVLLQAKARF
jgi:hypothetical protein